MGAAAMSRPLIGVTTSEVRLAAQADPVPEGDPPQREMALGMVYMRAVELAGGLPVVLPPLGHDTIGPLLDRLCGICLSGGPDIDPDGYGEPARSPQLGPTEPVLDAYELALAQLADARHMPVLGICRGSQAINVARGGTLHQHLADLTDGSIQHRQSARGRVPTHAVRIAPDSRLAVMMGVTEAEVNSFHHQAVDRIGKGLRAVAWSPDGVVESVEDDSDGMFMGVQWHSESLVEFPEQLALFRALVEEAEAYGSRAPAVRAA
jgi:putative glutamine amidotransferase